MKKRIPAGADVLFAASKNQVFQLLNYQITQLPNQKRL